MEKFDVYKDIANRTNGDIYIGVVGPVRTGKSTFITRFMEKMVLPTLQEKNEKKRVVDELPQSAGGKTIMTMQPKFVPNVAQTVELAEGVKANFRLVDCVGYLVDGAEGVLENGAPRFVKTPWSEEKMTMEQAAELGTHKVITEHATIAVVMTTDGTITDLSRIAYVQAEERAVAELKQLQKPFVVVLNSTNPEAEATQKLQASLQEKYGVPVVAMSVATMEKEDIQLLLEKVLYEFPVRKMHIALPTWMQALSADHALIQETIASIRNSLTSQMKMRDVFNLQNVFADSENFENLEMKHISLGSGEVTMEVKVAKNLFYSMLSQECGVEIADDFYLLSYMKLLTHAKAEYDKLQKALEQVKETGYGVVMPTMDEMKLEEPQIIKRGANSGVRLKASAPSLHIMRVDVETEVCPAVAGAGQSEELVKYLLSEFENNPQGIWETNMFGKPLSALVQEGICGKLSAFPEEAQVKTRKTLSKIVNEGKGGMIVILL